MRNRTRAAAGGVALGIAITAGLAGCTGDGTGTTPPVDLDPGKIRLVAYDSCGQALSQLKAAARPYVGAYGFGGGVTPDGGAEDRAAAEAPQAGAGPGNLDASAPEHSGTNVHEKGVDEPDLVKTDGNRIVTVADGVLRVIDVARREETGRLRLSDTVNRGEVGPGGIQLLVHGDRALVVLPGYPGGYDTPGGPEPRAYPVSGPEVLLVDLSGEPTPVSRMRLDGEYVDARMVDGTVRLVTRSVPRVMFEPPDGKISEAELRRRNLAILERTTIDDWLPRYEVTAEGRGVTRGRVGCGQVSHPVTYSGTSMLTVLSLDLGAAALGGERSVSIVADGRTVYGTGKHLYVANDQSMVRPFTERGAPGAVAPRTEVYKFDVSGAGAPRHVASGVVPGWLINQYAMSEHDGHLRIATTTGEPWGGPADRQPKTESAVYVLAHQGRRLERVGHVGGLGKGERIYAVRFAGAVGYVVTFRQVDPLYVVDLRDPAAPKVTGELKITGYSAYLHPVAGGRLIGVGQEASTQGQRLGLQVSLFDVSDPAAPNRLAQYHVEQADSAAEFDPHAFLYWPKTGLLVIPVMSHRAEPVDGNGKPTGPQGGALVLRLTAGGLTGIGTVSHPTPEYLGTVQRSLVIGGTLWTVSVAGLQANDAETLSHQAWVPFR